MSASFRGHKDFANRATPIYHEYVTREKLASLGFRQDFSQLDAHKAECFLIISTQLDKMKAEYQKKMTKKSGRGPRRGAVRPRSRR